MHAHMLKNKLKAMALNVIFDYLYRNYLKLLVVITSFQIFLSLISVSFPHPFLSPSQRNPLELKSPILAVYMIFNLCPEFTEASRATSVEGEAVKVLLHLVTGI